MIVLDASVLVDLVGDDSTAGQRARAVLAAHESAAIPDLADIETMHALRRLWLVGELATERFSVALDFLAALPVMRHPALPLLPRVFALKENLTPYDAVYVALAEALDCPLATADGRLARSPGIRCDVQLVG
ncbi:MAG: type II toxin-antitoxin system VapC family toxin [Acidimicrobiia bacterium]